MCRFMCLSEVKDKFDSDFFMSESEEEEEDGAEEEKERKRKEPAKVGTR